MQNEPDNIGGNQDVIGENDPPESSKPDEHTKKNLIFFPGGAPNQVFRFSTKMFSYGTDDKSHAAALILSFMLSVLMLALFLGGLIMASIQNEFSVEKSWISDALQILGPVFTLVVGVAVGQSTSK